mgnify:CR=1 FL=1
MKRLKTTLAAASCLFLLASCQWNTGKQEKTATSTQTKETVSNPEPSKAQPVKKNGKLTFSSYTYSDKKHIDNNSELPGCSIDISLTYPTGGDTGNSTVAALQRLFVNALPQEMQGSTSPRTAAEQYVQHYIAEYEAEIKPYIKKRKHRDEGWMNYETLIHSKNLYNANRFWGFSIECYSFTGGAHGMTTTSYTVVDLNSGKALSLNDLFAESDYNLISRMLRQQLADDLGTTVDKLGEKSYEADNIVVDDNFMIRHPGIYSLFNPHAIAPPFTCPLPTPFPSPALLRIPPPPSTHPAPARK